MSDDEIVANLLTFIIAGHEATAVALTWTLWLLAKDRSKMVAAISSARPLSSPAPVFFGLSPHCGGLRVINLHPMGERPER